MRAPPDDDEVVCLSAALALPKERKELNPLGSHLIELPHRRDQSLTLRERSHAGRALSCVAEHLLSKLPIEAIPAPEERAIVVGTASGALAEVESFAREIERVGAHLVNPGIFPFTVHNAPTGIAAIVSNCKGPNITISQGTESVILAADFAMGLLRTARAKLVLVGGVEIDAAFTNPQTSSESSRSACGLVAIVAAKYARMLGLLPKSRLFVSSIETDKVATGRHAPVLTHHFDDATVALIKFVELALLGKQACLGTARARPGMRILRVETAPII